MPFIPEDFDFEQWFKSRGLEVRDYQQDFLSHQLPVSLEKEKLPTVLAAGCSGGKTITSIALIDAHLQAHPKHRVLVLAHGTTVLRSQYFDTLVEADPNFTYEQVNVGKDIKTSKAQVVVTLPHTLHNVRGLPKFDLLVVDEAHHFYFKQDGMVQSIIKWTKPGHQLLLTGTPSKFILRDYPIIAIAVNELLDRGQITDPLVEIATSAYDFVQKDYNDAYDLKQDVREVVADTEATLDMLLEQVDKRLTSLMRTSPKLYAASTNTIGWTASLRRLGKTMVVARSQEQARNIQKYYAAHGLVSALCISDDDPDSKEIEYFKQDPDCLLVIVVGRGILGFNYPELMNVVDMTCSYNLNRVFQLFGRLIRKNGSSQQKFFLKVVPYTMEEYFRHMMSATLTLTDREAYLKYNGKNFMQLEVPTEPLKRISQSRKTRGPARTSAAASLKGRKPIDPTGLGAIGVMQDILHKDHGPLNPYAFATIQDIRNSLILKNRYSCRYTLKGCLESAAPHDTKGAWKKADKGAYEAAHRRGWADECCAYMTRRRTHTLESCMESASHYDNKTPWREGDPSAYAYAHKHGWVDKCCAHMVPLQRAHTKESLMENASHYDRRSAWEKGDPGAYLAASKRKLLDECCAYMEILRRDHTPESLMESAALHKTRGAWKKADVNAYRAAHRGGLVDKCCAHMTPAYRDHILESCLESAAPHDTKGAWKKADKGAYGAAYKQGWLDECCAHMAPLHRDHTLESIQESAANYDSRGAWKKGDLVAYCAAQKRGILNECCEHMGDPWGGRRRKK